MIKLSGRKFDLPYLNFELQRLVELINKEISSISEGSSFYIYIAYASDASGTGFTTVFNASLDYIGILLTTTEITNLQASNFTGLWKNYKGAAGASAFVYIAYASDTNGTGFTMTFNAALDYIAVLATTTAIPTPVVGDFAGLWKNYKGTAGTNGQGVPTGGTTGQALVKASNADYDTAWATISVAEIIFGWITGGSIDLASPTYPEVTYTITPV